MQICENTALVCYYYWHWDPYIYLLNFAIFYLDPCIDTKNNNTLNFNVLNLSLDHGGEEIPKCEIFIYSHETY